MQSWISEDFNIENLLTINMFIKKRMIDTWNMLNFWRVWYEETKGVNKILYNSRKYLIDDGYKVVVTETRNKDFT
jgi:hypothetical protein